MNIILSRKMRYQILSLFLVVSLLAALLPSLEPVQVLAEQTAVIYQPAKQEYGLLNIATSENKKFYDHFVKSTSDFNAISAFGLSYDTTYTRPAIVAKWDMGYSSALGKVAAPVLSKLREKGDLQMTFRATFYNSLHTSWSNHLFYEKLTYQIAECYQCYDILSYLTSTNLPTGYYTYGDQDFVQVGSGAPYSWFKLRLLTGGCTTCGNAQTSQLGLAFADRVSPQISSVTTTAGGADGKDSGVADTTFKAGDKVYIHLNFNEYIRFSDSSAYHSDMKLKMRLGSLNNDQDTTGLEAWADLYSLVGSQLTFVYTVPATLTNSNNEPITTNHRITGIEGVFEPNPADSNRYTRNCLNSAANPYQLQILGANGRGLIEESYGIFIDTLTEQEQKDLLTSRSLITDLAGNPSDYAMPACQSVYIDNVAPVVKNIQVGTANTCKTYAGPGSQLTFTATFSEALAISSVTGIQATLNILDGAAPVTVNAASFINEKDGVNGTEVTKITFSPLTITSTMTPDLYDGRGDLRLAVDSISFPASVTDLRGNPYTSVHFADTAAGEQKLPLQAFYLDTVSPEATTTIALDTVNQQYTPLYYGDGSDHNRFYFSFKVADRNTLGGIYTSGTNAPDGGSAVQGGFSWVDLDNLSADYAFEYCVTASSALSGSEQFSTGHTGSSGSYAFNEITSSNPGDDLYIHIRLLPNVAYNLSRTALIIAPADNAGNRGSVEFPLNYIADRVGPACSQDSYKSMFDTATNTGSITASLTLNDPSLVDTGSIAYKWVAHGADVNSVAWTSYTGAGDAAASVPLKITLPNLAGGMVHTQDLYIKASDLSALKNTAVSGPFTYTKDLSFPGYTVEVSQNITANPTFKISKPAAANGSGKGSTLIILIKDPLGNGSQYFMRKVDSTMQELVSGESYYFTNFNPDILAEAGYSAAEYGALNYWHYITLTENSAYTLHDGSVITPKFGFIGASSTIDYAGASTKRLQAIMAGKYYGDLQIDVISGYGIIGQASQSIQYNGDLIYDQNLYNEGNFVSEVKYYNASEVSYSYDLDCTDVPANPANTNHDHDINYIPSDATVKVDHYTLRAGASSVALTQNGTYAPNGSYPSYAPAINTAAITSLGDCGRNVNWKTPDDGARFKTSLAQQEFKIDLANNLMPERGLDDIDFDSADTFIALYLYASAGDQVTDAGDRSIVYESGTKKLVLNPSDKTSGLVWKTSLQASASQTIVLPDDLPRYSGQYILCVSMASKGAAKLDTVFYYDIFADYSSLGDFGPAKQTIAAGNGSGTFSNVITDILDHTTYEITAGSTVYSFNPLISYCSQDLYFNCEGSSQRLIYYTGNGVSYDAPMQDMYIKIWNTTDGVDAAACKAAADWKSIDNAVTDMDYQPIIIMNNAAGVLVQTNAWGDSIPVVKNCDNILQYQIANSAGEISGIKTLIIHVSDQTPNLNVRLDSDGSKPVTSVTLYAADLSGKSRSIFYTQNGVNIDFPSDGLKVTENGTYNIYAINGYGNYSTQSVTVNWIDATAPSLSVADLPGGAQEFCLTATITDEKDPAAASLYLGFDDAYAAIPGAPSGVVVPEAAGGGEWQAAGADQGGIYYTNTVIDTAAKTKTITVKGVYRHDPSGGSPAVRTLTLYAMDAAGNQSAAQTLQDTPVTAAPAFQSAALVNGKIRLTFNTPVLVIDPAESAAAPIFNYDKSDLPIYADGAYTLVYQDLFGETYTETIQITAFGEYSLQVGLTPSGPTNSNVTATIRTNSPNITLSLPASIPGASQISVAADQKSAVVIMTQNGAIPVALSHTTGDSQVRSISIDTIDKTAPAAAVHWYYAEFGSDSLPAGATSTNREVRVWLTCGESISGINGKTTSYTFSYGGPTSYTFEYADQAGNPGTPVTVNLPVTITPTPIVDTTAPTYSLDLYTYGKDVFTYKTTCPQSDLTAADTLTQMLSDIQSHETVALTGGYLFDLTIQDSSLTRILVLSGTNPDTGSLTFSSLGETISGVAVNGHEVQITANKALTIVIIDASNNITTIPVTTTLIDETIPTATVSYVQNALTGFYAKRAYIKLSDNTDLNNAAGSITIISPSGLSRDADPDSVYYGQYYLDFTENTSQQILFKDISGRIGSVTARVTDLDLAVPVATVDWWSPCYVDATGTANKNIPPNSMTNKPVTVNVTFSKPVAAVSWLVWDEASQSFITPAYWQSYWVDILAGTDSAQVTFYENTEIKLTFTGQNGIKGEKYLGPVQVIDTQAPIIQYDSDEPTDGSLTDKVTITFEFNDEPVYAYDCGEKGVLYPFGSSIEQTIIANGSYTYRFVDEAGNIQEIPVNVTHIDSVPPDLVVQGLPALNSPTAVKGPLTFYATLNEAGTITFGGQSYPVAAPVDLNHDGKLDADRSSGECDWIELSVEANGGYQITAQDQAGWQVYSYVEVACIDRTGPGITFSPARLTVKQGTALTDFNKMLMDGVTVQDNKTAAAGIHVDSETLTQEQLDKVGNYPLIYTATDGAGNITTATRYVRVYDKNELAVTLNGVKTDAGSTIILSGTDTVTLAIANLTAGEPYTVYLKDGRRTAGQMKSGTETIAGSTFKISRDGFYTLFIVTQSREAYITYFYVQQ
ncbi:MAG: hypothetical protein VB070_11425 [Clostridiaceae bacterium]|nr:hypothetical protein [Clostridiaceae bacterium]